MIRMVETYLAKPKGLLDKIAEFILPIDDSL